VKIKLAGMINLSYDFHKHKSSIWVIDSEATDHMTFSDQDIMGKKIPRRDTIFNANGGTCVVTGARDVSVSPSLTLSNTLVVPSLSTKLISVGQLTKDLNCVIFMYPKFYIFQTILTKEIIGRGTKRGGLYHLDDWKNGSVNLTKSISTNREGKIWRWHRRLGHPSFGYMRKLMPIFFSDLDISVFECETCIKAKSYRVSYPISISRSNSLFDLVHSDVWGSSPINLILGYKWFILFIDDCTRMTWIYLMKGKDELANIFKGFYNIVEK
jgi:GAG-pre-integrase domain